MMQPSLPAPGKLVIGRHPGESVVITTPEGRQVILEVVQVRPRQVRLAFQAQREVRIVRAELVPEPPGEGES